MLLIIVIMPVSSLIAQTVHPLVFDLHPSGSEASEAITLKNTTDGILTVEVSAFAIDVAEDGAETLSPADNVFVVFPPTAVIDPGNLQAFRVQYVGDPEIKTSESYRISIKQLPVDLSDIKEGFGIQVLMAFNTLTNVVPVDTNAEPIVEEIYQDSDDGYWNIRVRNAGNRYLRHVMSEWTIQGPGGQTEKLSGRDFIELNKGGLLLPKSTQVVKVPAPVGFSPDSTKIAILSLQ